MSESKKEAENPSEITFKAERKTITQSELVKVLSDLGGKDLDSTTIRDALKLEKETGRRCAVSNFISILIIHREGEHNTIRSRYRLKQS